MKDEITAIKVGCWGFPRGMAGYFQQFHNLSRYEDALTFRRLVTGGGRG